MSNKFNTEIITFPSHYKALETQFKNQGKPMIKKKKRKKETLKKPMNRILKAVKRFIEQEGYIILVQTEH